MDGWDCSCRKLFRPLFFKDFNKINSSPQSAYYKCSTWVQIVFVHKDFVCSYFGSSPFSWKSRQVTFRVNSFTFLHQIRYILYHIEAHLQEFSNKYKMLLIEWKFEEYTTSENFTALWCHMRRLSKTSRFGLNATGDLSWSMEYLSSI